MASDVDLCNLALAHLGDEAAVASIDPPDGSAQAAHCSRFYSIARNALLEMHEWSFATRRDALATVSVTLPDQWAFSYALPNLCLSPKRVLSPGALDDAESEDFLIEAASDGSRVLFTNVEDATLVYVKQVSDTSKFTGLFNTALARLLSSYLAGPILKGKSGMTAAREELKQFFAVDLPIAAAADARGSKRSNYEDFTPSSIGARS